MNEQQKEMERLKKIARKSSELYDQLRLFRDLIVWNTDDNNRIKLPQGKEEVLAKLNKTLNEWELL